MITKENTRRLWIFILLAFGLSWLFALIVYLTGGLADSPVLFPGTPITVALVLFAVGFMWSPALAHILTRLITREGWKRTFIKPNFRRAWPYWLIAWVTPGLLSIAGVLLFFLLFPGNYDSDLGFIRDQLQQTSGSMDVINPWVMVAASTIQAIIIAPLVNGLFTFGEEFGWRAYLQPKLMPLGGRKAVLITGIIWGVWHWPAIIMGHNYGLEYSGYPWAGMLVMVWFTFLTGTFLGWVTIKGDSVWPAVIGHGAINGIASIGFLFIQGQPNPLLGPAPTGIIASIPWVIFALILFIFPNALKPPHVDSPGSEEYRSGEEGDVNVYSTINE